MASLLGVQDAIGFVIPGVEAGLDALGVTSGAAAAAEGATGLAGSLANEGPTAEIVGELGLGAGETVVDAGAAVMSNERAREAIFEQMWKSASRYADARAERAWARGAELLGEDADALYGYVESGDAVKDVFRALGLAAPAVGLAGSFVGNWDRMMNSGSPMAYEPEASQYPQPVYEPEPDYVYSGQRVPVREPFYVSYDDIDDPVADPVKMSGSSSTGGRPKLPDEDTRPSKSPRTDQDDVMFQSPDLPFEFRTPGDPDFRPPHRRRKQHHPRKTVSGHKHRHGRWADEAGPSAVKRRRLDFGAY